MEVPEELLRPPTYEERIRDLIRAEMSAAAEEVGAESFEEANDFDVGEEGEDPFLTDMQILVMAEEELAGREPVGDRDPEADPSSHASPIPKAENGESSEARADSPESESPNGAGRPEQ